MTQSTVESTPRHTSPQHANSPKDDVADQLAADLRRSDAELEKCTNNINIVHEVRYLYGCANAELRAAARASAIERSEHASEALSLRESLAEARAMAKECSRLQEPIAFVEQKQPQADEGLAAATTDSDSVTPLALAAERESELRIELAREKEMHDHCLRLLTHRKVEGDQVVSEMEAEMTHISTELEQKEEDVLNIQFEMIDVKNRLEDTAKEVMEKADAVQRAAQELADKDDKLSEATQKQEELMAQLSEVTTNFAKKVTSLSEELAGSRAAYQTLEEKMRTVVAQLEIDRDSVALELSRFKEKLQSKEEDEELMKARLACATAQVATAKVPDANLLERLATAETQLIDLSAELDRSRLLERQALQRAQQYRTSLELYREFGEDFLLPTVQQGASDSSAVCKEPSAVKTAAEESGRSSSKDVAAAESFARCGSNGIDWLANKDARLPSIEGCGTEDVQEAALSKVLIAVELEIGGKTATLSVAPWQTSSDFDEVVQEFLTQHRIKPVFKDALVEYLEEVESQSTIFPAVVQADLSDLYSRYG